jgi:hypothetical protein
MRFDLDKEDLSTYLKNPISFTVRLRYWLVPEKAPSM